MTLREHDHLGIASRCAGRQGPRPHPGTGGRTGDAVEYGDYQCPFCGRARPIVKKVRARMGDRLRFVFRDFPISTSHPNAEHAAEAAEAAAGPSWPDLAGRACAWW